MGRIATLISLYPVTGRLQWTLSYEKHMSTIPGKLYRCTKFNSSVPA
jgi:hypothetical protein